MFHHLAHPPEHNVYRIPLLIGGQQLVVESAQGVGSQRVAAGELLCQCRIGDQTCLL